MSIAVTAAPGRIPAPARSREKAPALWTVLGTLALGGAPALALAMTVARGGGLMSNPWVLPLALITLAVNTAIILADLRYGLALFILAAGLSPKLPGLYNNLRVEDFVFVLMLLSWLSKRAQNVRMEKVTSPIIVPFLALTIMSLFSSAYGMALGYLTDPIYGAFLQFKRIEYFLIFYVVASTIRSEAWLRILTLTFILSGAIAAVYGLTNQSSEGSHVSTTRVMGPEGENYNTLSGYLVVCIAAGLAALPAFRSLYQRALIIASIGVAGAGVLFSFSREGLIMLAGTVVFFGFTRHRMILVLGVIGLVAAFVFSEPVRKNVDNTLVQIRESRTADPGGNSLSARYQTWIYRWNGFFLREPLLGNGVGSVSLSVDNEYLMRACEVGLVGFALFCWWLTAIGQQVKRLLRAEGLPRGLALGLAAGFTGLLIQGTVAASFTSIRTMEPFWFLLGLTACGFRLYRQELLARSAEAEGAAEPAETVPTARRRARPRLVFR